MLYSSSAAHVALLACTVVSIYINLRMLCIPLPQACRSLSVLPIWRQEAERCVPRALTTGRQRRHNAHTGGHQGIITLQPSLLSPGLLLNQRDLRATLAHSFNKQVHCGDMQADNPSCPQTPLERRTCPVDVLKPFRDCARMCDVVPRKPTFLTYLLLQAPSQSLAGHGTRPPRPESSSTRETTDLPGAPIALQLWRETCSPTPQHPLACSSHQTRQPEQAAHFGPHQSLQDPS